MIAFQIMQDIRHNKSLIDYASKEIKEGETCRIIINKHEYPYNGYGHVIQDEVRKGLIAAARGRIADLEAKLERMGITK